MADRLLARMLRTWAEGAALATRLRRGGGMGGGIIGGGGITGGGGIIGGAGIIRGEGIIGGGEANGGVCVG